MPSKKWLVVILFWIFAAQNGFSQDSLHASWHSSFHKISEREYELHVKGTVQPDWHIYTKDKQAEGLDGIKLVWQDSSVRISGNLKIIGAPKIEADKLFDNQPLEVIENEIEIIQPVTFATPPGIFKYAVQYNIAKAEEFYPEEQKLADTIGANNTASAKARILIPSIDLKHPAHDCGGTGISTEETQHKGLFTLFILGFLGGLVALLTPCVFPMIPLTVSFFTKKAVNKRKGRSNAIVYGLFIFLIYVGLSLPFHFLDRLNPEILNNISTNVYLNILFFIVFIIFAISFFGYFEITLPARFSTMADSKAGAGNLIGIFFMALTLALVSFSCTGPILGSLLAGSLTSNGGAVQLTVGMGGFGLALALPFALFALFPNWLNSLPKSGGWLNTVKVVLGFLEVGLAFKFLSNADLVKHWGLLKREIFIGIWVLDGIGLALYLAGKIRFPHDAHGAQISKARMGLALASLLFALYLVPGLTNTRMANLKLISGFPPPLYYSIYQKDNDCILNLNCTKDYAAGLKMAKALNKPILLDFTGYACVNCRKMEETIWTNKEVYDIMKEHYIVISLYVDDKKQLPQSEQFTYKTKNGFDKEIVTVGDKWATFESENFENNAQPLYAIISPDEKLLTHPVPYTPDANAYRDWLLCGLGKGK